MSLAAVQAGPHQQTFAGQPAGGVFGSLATTLAGMYGMGQKSPNESILVNEPFSQQDNIGTGGTD